MNPELMDTFATLREGGRKVFDDETASEVHGRVQTGGRCAVAAEWPAAAPRQELTIAALTMAIQRQRPALGFIHHSDRGSQYAAGDYRELLKANGIVPSMSRKGNCWDNAPMESWFHILKTELVHHTGGRKVIVAPDGGDAWAPSRPRPDEALIRAVARAHRWNRLLEQEKYRSASELAEAEGLTRSFVNRLLRLTLLAPDIVEAILDGRQARGLQLEDLTQTLPDVWNAQRQRLLGR